MSELTTQNYVFEEPEEQSDRIVLPAGKPFPFSILEINQIKLSKNGNPMIPLKMEFDGGNLGKSIVYENLVFAENMKWKINSFLKCVAGDAIKAGKQINFEDSAFLEWLRRRKGVATLKVEPVLNKTYDRNSVESYVYDGSSKTVSAPTLARSEPPMPAHEPADQGDDFDEDNIPF